MQQTANEFHKELFTKIENIQNMSYPELSILSTILLRSFGSSIDKNQVLVALEPTKDNLIEMSADLILLTEAAGVALTPTTLARYYGYVAHALQKLRESSKLTSDGYSSNPHNVGCFRTVVGSYITKAMPLTRGVYNEYKGWDHPISENPNDKGMMYVQSNGNESWMTLEAFNGSFRTPGKFTYGDALVLLKSGERVMRHGWNGRNMFIELMLTQEHTGSFVHGKSVTFNHGAYTVICNMNNKSMSVWVPSPTDHLAEDWDIFVEEV